MKIFIAEQVTDYVQLIGAYSQLDWAEQACAEDSEPDTVAWSGEPDTRRGRTGASRQEDYRIRSVEVDHDGAWYSRPHEPLPPG